MPDTIPATPEDLFARFAELGVETTTQRHPPVFTVEESKAFRGTGQRPETLYAQAADVRARFTRNGGIIGALLGLFLAGKLVSFSVRRRRSDYEPDRGTCVSCARCFMSCPRERLQRKTKASTQGAAETA